MTKPKGILRPAEDSKPKKPKLKKNEGSNAAESENCVIGQEVHGVVDGSFDAGYLLTVKVGDSPLVLRGLVFAPGMTVPLSSGNDVVPTIKATARDHQVVPTSPQLSPTTRNLAPAARLSSMMPSQDLPGTTQILQNEGHAADLRMLSAEQMHNGPDHSSPGGDNPLISEKNHAEEGSFMMNGGGQVYARETDINSIVKENGSEQQFGHGGADGHHTTEAVEAGLQRPLVDACAHDSIKEVPSECKDLSDDHDSEIDLQAK